MKNIVVIWNLGCENLKKEAYHEKPPDPEIALRPMSRLQCLAFLGKIGKRNMDPIARKSCGFYKAFNT